MDLYYQRIEHNNLLDLLKHGEISSALAYIIDYTDHDNLTVIPKEHSIEVSNNTITIAIILFVGFEMEEYEALKHRENLHIVTFSNVVSEMLEFEKLNVKYVDNLALLFTTLSRSESPLAKNLFRLKSLKS
jgi:hypothetical protein